MHRGQLFDVLPPSLTWCLPHDDSLLCDFGRLVPGPNYERVGFVVHVVGGVESPIVEGCDGVGDGEGVVEEDLEDVVGYLLLSGFGSCLGGEGGGSGADHDGVGIL